MTLGGAIHRHEEVNAQRYTTTSWAPFCISYTVFVTSESIRGFPELVALRSFSRFCEESGSENYFSIRRKNNSGIMTEW